MKIIRFLFFLVLICQGNQVFPEGTKQILLADTGYGKIQVQPSFSPFAFYDNTGSPPEEYRLHIHIERLNEKICYGFGDPLQFDGTVFPLVSFRIKDPAGNIVVGPVLIPVSGNGHISTFDQAVAGPSPVAGPAGYSPLTYYPSVTGDFTIEFNFNTSTFGTYRVAFRYFDITVVNAGNQAVNGRLWSRAWQMTTDDFGNPFLGKLFVLTDDSIVTSVNFNGMEPFVFSASCNPHGCFNTGNLATDRKSITGNHTLPWYKTFLNDPDSTIYPTGVPGRILPPVDIQNFCDGSVHFIINVTKPGLLSLLLNIDPAPGVQPVDVLITDSVASQHNELIWDGIDGLGQPVANGTVIEAILSYMNGLTNLPIYDVEAMTNGFIIEPVRPPGATPVTYWDDRLIPSGGFNLSGCLASLPTTGCHSWTGGGGWGMGNNNTINTWWYINTETSNPIPFSVVRTPDTTGVVTGLTSFCSDTTVVYMVAPDPNLTAFYWSYSGTGATITGDGNPTVSIYFAPPATSGILTVRGFNECGLAIPSTLPITIIPKPSTSGIYHR